jgi:hypothetical protein
MTSQEVFRLKRPLDGLEYSFSKESGEGKDAIYCRSDSMARIRYDVQFGWSTWDEDNGALAGRVWDVLPEHQDERPTAGVWVSRKGDKSYVYQLIYTGTAE